ELIKLHGWQVAPAELEAVLLTHSQVVSAAMIGVPMEDRTGERPHAFVVLKPKCLGDCRAHHLKRDIDAATEEELKANLASRLAKYKALQGVTFVPDIPWTASGKLQKFKIKGDIF
ncbi:MAG: hypothetical protein Q9177_006748, partial [Variospora cf. flavescens]